MKRPRLTLSAVLLAAWLIAWAVANPPSGG